MSKELSTELVTHKLIISWVWIKYITKKFAENIFSQLIDEKTKTVKISNPSNFTYLEKYKNDVQLFPLDDEEKSTEDIIALSWLSQIKKEEVRGIIEERKKEKKPVTSAVISNIILVIKEK